MKVLGNMNAVVTGGSYGVGVRIAEALVKEGANVALVARSADKLKQVADRLATTGIRAVAFPADLSNVSDRAKLINRIRAELGEIDILVNNAGIVGLSPFVEQKQTEITHILETNLAAPLFLTREVLPAMIKRGQGHVVTISSLSGKKGVLNEATYAGTKAALIEWTSAVRMELKGTGVGISVICPIYISDSGELALYGLKAPWLVGPTTTHKVAKAVIAGIKHNSQEIIVRTGPTRPLLAINALSPGLGNFIVKWMGAIKLQTQLAELAKRPNSASS